MSKSTTPRSHGVLIRHHRSVARRPTAVVLAFIVTMSLQVLPASALVVLDQSNTGVAVGSVLVNSTRDRGQTFVAGVTGSLVSIRLNGCDFNDDTISLTVAVYPASGLAPNSVPDVSGAPLAQQTLTGSALSILPPRSACPGNEGGEFTITFDAPAMITAGTAYTFTLDATQTVSASQQGVLLASTVQADYPQGNRSTYATGPSWVAEPTRNIVFATFVEDGRPSVGSDTAQQTFSLSTSTRCVGVSPSGNAGTWITLPAAGACTAPEENPNAKLLGWATSPNFPVEIAKRQVTNGWGAYETFNEAGELTGVFIPAGGATLLSASGQLYPIWN